MCLWDREDSDCVVLPMLAVNNSNFSPRRLTFPLDAPYASFSEGDCPFSSFQAKRAY